MTVGSPAKHIVAFSLPLIAGFLFQMLYNTVDTWVVGNFVSDEAFSAVGTVGPIINMLIGAFMGLSSGAGVVISQYFGAGDEKSVREAVHTSMVMTLVLGVLFTVIGIAYVPLMLRITKTPANVFPESSAYLTIYFSGLMGLLVYNMGAAILRAVGDSQRPFYYLVVSALTNIVLDLVFVLVFRMGVRGVALATIIAQALSAVLAVIAMFRSNSCIRLELKMLKVNWSLLKKIFTVGIPTSLQQAVTSFSNVFVQSYINQFGSDCMGGWTAYAKIDQFALLPIQALTLAVTTFVGQNLGKGLVDRARRGIRTSLLLSLGVTVFCSGLLVIFAPQLVGFFNSSPAIIDYGKLFLRWLTPFFLINAISQILSGALRGAGNSTAPTVIMLLSFVAFRQVYLFIMSKFISNTILPIALGYPAGWIVCTALTWLYYRKTDITKYCVVKET